MESYFRCCLRGTQQGRKTFQDEKLSTPCAVRLKTLKYLLTTSPAKKNVVGVAEFSQRFFT